MNYIFNARRICTTVTRFHDRLQKSVRYTTVHIEGGWACHWRLFLLSCQVFGSSSKHLLIINVIIRRSATSASHLLIGHREWRHRQPKDPGHQHHHHQRRHQKISGDDYEQLPRSPGRRHRLRSSDIASDVIYRQSRGLGHQPRHHQRHHQKVSDIGITSTLRTSRRRLLPASWRISGVDVFIIITSTSRHQHSRSHPLVWTRVQSILPIQHNTASLHHFHLSV